MIAGMDFAMLPPEVNSARMYAGSGSGPMMAAGPAAVAGMGTGVVMSFISWKRRSQRSNRSC